MKKYNLQEQIVTIESLNSLYKRNIMPLGIDIEAMPNDFDLDVLNFFKTYYVETSQNRILVLNISKVDTEYANGLIGFKRYIKVNPTNGDIFIFQIKDVLNVLSDIENYFSVIIQPFFLKSDETEHIFIKEKISKLLENYSNIKRKNEKVRSL